MSILEVFGQARTNEMIAQPKSLAIIPHLSRAGSLGDLALFTTVAMRIKAAGIDQVSLAYCPDEQGYHAQLVPLLKSSRIDFCPLPQGIFEENFSEQRKISSLFSTYKSLFIQNPDRIAIMGASQARFIPKSPWRSRLDYFPRDIFYGDEHIVTAYSKQLIQAYHVKKPLGDQVPVFTIPQNDKKQVMDWVQKEMIDLGKPYVVINPNTSSHAKNWPMENYLSLTKKLEKQSGFSIIVINAPDDFFVSQGDISLQLHLFPKSPLPQTIELIQYASTYVGGDTGLTHIAAMTGTPFVALYPSVNLKVWSPLSVGQPMKIISSDQVKDISVAEVFTTTQSILDQSVT